MAETLELTVRKEGPVGVVETAGYINNTGGEKVAGACLALINEGMSRLVLNLKGSNIVNSVGVSFLIEVIEEMRARNGQMAFCCLSPTIAKTFQIMGLLDHARLFPTEPEALQALAGAP